MLADQLAEAIQHIEGLYTEVEVETPDIADGTSRLGGKGHCFTCLICGQKRNLWLEQGKWFVEAYCSVPESRAS